MFDQLEAVRNRYEEVALQLQDPSVLARADRYRDLMKEYKELTPIVEKYEEYRKASDNLAEAKALFEEGGLDADFRELVRAEYEQSKTSLDVLTDELKLLLLPQDGDDGRNVIVEIRSGTGGEEAALFGYDVYRMYSMYAERHHWKTEIIGLNETELGGYKEVSFSVEGENVYSRLKYESGVHRVQRVPDTESQGRIQTSAITVAIMPEAEEVELQISPSDLKIDTFRSSGAGGQHINKTSSAIRITHLPTGMVVECQDERSQYKNKDKAMKVLRSRLFEMEREKKDADYALRRRLQVGSGDRSERIRTYNFPQGRVTDHRINLTVYRLEAVMNGDLDEIIDALITADRAQKLKNADASFV